jgi:hypothetical protein
MLQSLDTLCIVAYALHLYATAYRFVNVCYLPILQSRGSELIIRHGKPEVELPKILKDISGTALYCHQEV